MIHMFRLIQILCPVLLSLFSPASLHAEEKIDGFDLFMKAMKLQEDRKLTPLWEHKPLLNYLFDGGPIPKVVLADIQSSTEVFSALKKSLEKPWVRARDDTKDLLFIQTWQEASLLMLAQAMYLNDAGRSNEADLLCQLQNKLITKLNTHGFALCYLLTSQIQKVNYRLQLKLHRGYDLNQLKRLMDRQQKLFESRPDEKDVIKLEKRSMRITITNGMKEHRFSSGPWGIKTDKMRQICSQEILQGLDTKVFNRWEKLIALPTSTFTELNQRNTRLAREKESAISKWKDGLARARTHEQVAKIEAMYILATIYTDLDMFHQVLSSHRDWVSWERLFMTHLALRSFYLQHGTYPRKLSDLHQAKIIAPRMLIDPHTRKPFIYKPAAANSVIWPLVYGVGSNLKDDGGTHSPRLLSDEGDVIYKQP